MYKSAYLNNLLKDVKERYANEPEFLAAVEEFLYILLPPNLLKNEKIPPREN